MERYHGAQGGGGSAGGRACPPVPVAVSSPAVIYSYKATGDFAPTFVSQNIRDLLGYEPHEYLESADFWRRCVHPDELAAVEAESVQLFKKGRHTVEYRFLKKDGSYCWVNDEQHLSATQTANRWRSSARGATSPSASGRKKPRRPPRIASTSARQRAGGDLQLQGNGRLLADVHQPERQGPARL